MYIFTFSLVLSLFTAVSGQLPKWCVTSSEAKLKCDNVAKGLSGRFSCVLGSDEKDCYKKIVAKSADFGVFDGGMIYHAGKDHDLRAIMAENFASAKENGTAYYAVAVVKKNSGITINSLKGKKSCHTGVQKTSGWKVPVGTLLSKKLMSWVDCDQYASVANFFSSSCAPGANDRKYNTDMKNASKLCQLCSGAGSNKCSRSAKEPYYSYSGAFKCLKDGTGDVAFIKASTVLADKDKDNYRLLCPDGSVTTPNFYKSCNFARVSSHAVMARKEAPIAIYQKILKDADQKYGEKAASSLKLYGDGVLFSKSTVSLSEVALANQPYKKYLDSAYIDTVSVLERCAKWCVTSTAAANACKTVAAKAGSLSCVLGADEADCSKKIAEKHADVGMFDGGSIYHAGKKYQLKAIMSESLKNGSGSDTSYYAVAVVKKDSPLTIATLKGKKSCHTGVQKTSGWIVPLGHLLRKKYMTWTKDCNQYATVANFFSASCAPGANSLKYNSKGAGVDKLCSLCSGSGDKKCSRSSKEPYYSYKGAFKCLTDDIGEVAFVKQSTVLAGDAPQYKLLCRDGTTKAPQYFEACNLARVPSHAMLTRADAPIAKYQEIFQSAITTLGNDLYKPAGVLFSSSVSSLQKVIADKQIYHSYLDKAYMQDIAELEACISSASTIHLSIGALVFLWVCIKAFV